MGFAIKRVAINSLLSTTIYCLLYIIQFFIIFPVEAKLSEQTGFASFLFLPHAARVLSFSVMGWSCWPGLVIGHLTMFVIFRDGIDNGAILMHILVGATCAPVAFEILRFLKVNASAIGNQTLEWKHILLCGIIASVINSFIGLWFIEGMIPAEVVFVTIWTFLVGDLLGLIAVMLLLSALIIEIMKNEKKFE